MPLDITKFINSLEKEYRPRARQAAINAVYNFGQHVLKEAQQLAPIATGFLKSSATSDEVNDQGGNKLSITIGFNCEYAAAVHERLTNKFSGKTIIHPQGQAKFLETSMRANIGQFEGYVQREMEKAVP